MPLTLCPNCRLPVNTDVQNCPFCTAALASPARHMPVAAAVALVATLAVLTRRRT